MARAFSLAIHGLLSQRRCAAVLTPSQGPLVVIRGSPRQHGDLGEQAVVSQPVELGQVGQTVEAPALEEGWGRREGVGGARVRTARDRGRPGGLVAQLRRGFPGKLATQDDAEFGARTG
jgi:hypothetical protein